MSVNETFVSRKNGIDCPMCPSSGTEAEAAAPDLVLSLPSGKVHLQNDANYRGYCVLVFKHHKTEIHELSDADRRTWIDDIALIERAIVTVCGPQKINIAMLGNLVPHLHCHIIPRYFQDTEWGAPPQFRTPSERQTLDDNSFVELASKLRERILKDPSYPSAPNRDS